MKPILFNTEMVQAILEGRKTVTRRKIKLDLGLADADKNDSSYLMVPDNQGDYHKAEDYCKYQAGDVLYVKEAFNDEETDTVLYAADSDFIDRGLKEVDNHIFIESEIKWKPSIHMPKDIARIFLKVTDVKVERVKDITDKEAKREGITVETNNSGLMYKVGFANLWNDIYGDWKINPYVYVINFKVLEGR